MTKKEKAPTSAATLTGAAAETTACRASIPMFDCTTAAAGRQIKIADYLGHSPESAITGRELCALTRLDHRTVRAQIEQERRGGQLIVSDCQHGYWLTSDPAEAQRFACSMRHRARQIVLTAQAIEEAAGLD